MYNCEYFSAGGWRGIRAENNVLTPPSSGWGEDTYVVTESSGLKRKSERDADSDSERSSSRRSEREERRKQRKSRKLLEDMIVLGLPFATTQEEFHEYFTER